MIDNPVSKNRQAQIIWKDCLGRGRDIKEINGSNGLSKKGCVAARRRWIHTQCWLIIHVEVAGKPQGSVKTTYTYGIG